MQILFYIHTSKAKKNGLAPLKIRITVGPTDRTEWSTGKFVHPDLWDVERKRVTGKSVNADILNKFIVTQESKLMKIEGDLQNNETPFTAEIIRNIYQGKHVARYGLLQVLDIHNELFRQRLGQKGFAQSTLDKYEINLKGKLEYYIKEKYSRSDLFISEIDFDFIESFFLFLLTKGKQVRGNFAEPMDPESACGIITRLKKIVKMGLKRQGIAINPVEEFKPTFSKEDKEPLNDQEIHSLVNHDFSRNKRLDRVRDRAVVGCFTGMANIDIQGAHQDMIVTDITGQKWIDKGRTKTQELCIIPLWKPVLDIIEKYKNDPELIATGRIFPQISLDKMNKYLREVGFHCEITKPLTTHIFRHTYGDIYINAGGTIENLARILGHSSTRSTRRYAKRNKNTILKEANDVKETIFAHLSVISQRKTS